MQKVHIFGVFALLAACLAASVTTLQAQEPVISEIMAVNHSTLADEDGDFTDWIELYNPSSQPVNLKGWFLTDDSDNLKKWEIPEVELTAGGVLLVFASEKERAVRGRELHTNFRLDPDGEFLALVKPDGATVASAMAPKYPLQVADVSHGIPMSSDRTTLLAAGAEAKVFVPADESLGQTWKDPAFDDSAWPSGPTGLGFDKKATPTYADLIKTNLEAAMYKLNTTAYVRLAFDVADPSGLSVLLLRMQFEDGFVASINGTEVARANAPPTLVWNSKAPARRPEAEAVKQQVFNISSAIGLLKPGRNVLAIHALNDSSTATAADFLVLPVIESVKVTGAQVDKHFYFEDASPGLPNDGTGAPAVAEAATFSHASGTYADPISVELKTTTPGATIRYTIDRTAPTASSPEYTAPISVSVTTMIRAKVFAPDLLPSNVESGTYLILNTNSAGFTSNLPLMVVESFGKPLPEDPLTFCYITIHENPAGRTALADPPVIATRAGMKKRGSSSLGFPKNNYAIELWDEENLDYEAEMLGMPRESDWIIHGPYSDKSLMRNYLTYDYSNQMGRWAVHCRFVELFLNQSGTKIDAADYWGVYVFMEKIKRGDDRVDIRRLYASQTEPPEITGGYILKNDRLDPGDSGLTTKRGLRLAYVYPKEREATPAQKAYIKGFLDEFETALYGANFKNPDTGYQKYFDMDAAIDHHILTELVKNIDGYRLSTFMFKDREGKLNMGPAWDYNLSLGNADYLNGWNPEGWYYREPDIINNNQNYPWYPQLFKDEAFLARYKERWIQLRQDFIQVDPMLAQIDEIAAYLEEAQTRNFNKWRTLGTYVWPNKFIAKTYAEEIAFMKGWLRDRILWMDSTFVTVPVFSSNGGEVESGFKLTISAPAGAIYYTTNGEDPRTPDGSPSPGSVLYDDAQGVVITKNVRVQARAKVGFTWSAIKAATFVTEVPPIVITEIMYNPAPPPAGSPFRTFDYEFLEIQNIGSQPFDLTGSRLTRGVLFDFSTGGVKSLEPGQYAVIVRKTDAFLERYGNDPGIVVLGQWGGDLSDAGEPITLKGPVEETILDFPYDDVWYVETDGQGKSLVLIDPNAPRSTFGQKTAWRTSGEFGGSPGRADEIPKGGRQRPGDISQDGQLNITDAINLLRYLFQGLLTELPCAGGTKDDPGNKALADVDGDGGVNLTDAVFTLRYLFQEGPPPALGVDCVRIEGCTDVCAP